MHKKHTFIIEKRNTYTNNQPRSNKSLFLPDL
jgi:hypothetical protein